MSFKNPLITPLFEEDMVTVKFDQARNMFNLSDNATDEDVRTLVYNYISQTNLSGDIEFIKANLDKLQHIQIVINSRANDELLAIGEIRFVIAQNIVSSIVESPENSLDYIEMLFKLVKPETVFGVMDEVLKIQTNVLTTLALELNSLPLGAENFYEMREQHEVTMASYRNFNTAIVSQHQELAYTVKDNASLFNLAILAVAKVAVSYDDIVNDVELLKNISESDIDSAKQVVASEEEEGSFTSIQGYNELIKISELHIKSIELYSSTLMALREAELAQMEEGTEVAIDPSDFPEE